MTTEDYIKSKLKEFEDLRPNLKINYVYDVRDNTFYVERPTHVLDDDLFNEVFNFDFIENYKNLYSNTPIVIVQKINLIKNK